MADSDKCYVHKKLAAALTSTCEHGHYTNTNARPAFIVYVNCVHVVSVGGWVTQSLIKFDTISWHWGRPVCWGRPGTYNSFPANEGITHGMGK